MRKNLFLYLILIINLVSTFAYSQTQDHWNKFRLAQGYENIGNYEKAYELYRELYLSFPTQFQFYDAYLRMLTQLKKYDEAIILLKEKLSQNPEDYNLYGELAVLYERKGIKDSVEFFIKQGLNRNPNNSISYKFIANILIQNRMFDYANKVLEEGKNRTSDNEMFIIDLININTILMNYQKACNEMIELLKKQPQHISFVQNKLAQVITNPAGLETAVQVFEKNLDKKNFPIIKLLSWLYFQNKNFSKAFELTLEIEKLTNSNGYEILEFSNRAYQEGFIQEAVRGYEYIIKNFKERKDLEAMSVIGLARSYEQLFQSQFQSKELFWKLLKPSADTSNKNLKEALKYYAIIFNNYTLTNLVAEALYKSAYLYKEHFRDYTKAKELLKRLINDYVLTDFYSQGVLLSGDIEKILGNYDNALDYYEKVRIFSRANETERSLAQFQIAEILIHKGLIDSAKSVLNSIKKITTNDVANDAIEFLMLITEQENSPQTLKIYVEIERLIEAKQFEEAIKKITSLNLDDEYSIFQNKLRMTLAELYITTNRFSDALAQLNYLYELKEKSIYSDKALYRIGQLYLYGLNDKSRAEQSFNKLLAEFPSSIFVTEVRALINQIQSEQF
ncbi:MAG: tetratricopeptide repeat protein [Ignavibacteria bacterium]|nr:tetratricopeptide repeat protein [Ignavibacteria bacterium]